MNETTSGGTLAGAGCRVVKIKSMGFKVVCIRQSNCVHVHYFGAYNSNMHDIVQHMSDL